MFHPQTALEGLISLHCMGSQFLSPCCMKKQGSKHSIIQISHDRTDSKWCLSVNPMRTDRPLVALLCFLDYIPTRLLKLDMSDRHRKLGMVNCAYLFLLPLTCSLLCFFKLIMPQSGLISFHSITMCFSNPKLPTSPTLLLS